MFGFYWGNAQLYRRFGEGYTGKFCNAREMGYSLAAKNVCSRCPEAERYIFMIIGLSFLASIAASIFV